MPLGGSTIFMYSVDPRNQTLKDFRDGDKIAISASEVKNHFATLPFAAIEADLSTAHLVMPPTIWAPIPPAP